MFARVEGSAFPCEPEERDGGGQGCGGRRLTLGEQRPLLHMPPVLFGEPQRPFEDAPGDRCVDEHTVATRTWEAEQRIQCPQVARPRREHVERKRGWVEAERRRESADEGREGDRVGRDGDRTGEGRRGGAVDDE